MRTAKKKSLSRSERERARLQRQTREMNEQLVLAGLHQQELAEASEKLNAQLKAEIAERKHAEKALRLAQGLLSDRAVQLEELVAERTANLSTAHEQLLAETHERKRLEGQIARAVEAEQLRIGEELHDGLAQELTAAAMMLCTLEKKMGKASVAHVRKVHEVQLMLLGTTKRARNLARGFYPVDLEEQGLGVALQELAQRTQESFDISCAVEAETQPRGKAEDVRSIQLFRIAQEAVHNATKHARAKHILIRLTTRDGALLLTVKDDGIGLRPTRRRTNGMGMHIMQHRVGLIGGKLEVCNADGGGVMVSCVVPGP